MGFGEQSVDTVSKGFGPDPGWAVWVKLEICSQIVQKCALILLATMDVSEQP